MASLTFYFDRCFGTRLPDAIRCAQPPFAVEFHHDKRSRFKFKQDIADDEWLSIVGQQGWIVFSHDRKFHKIEAERVAIKQHRIGCFYLYGNNALTWDKLRAFMRGLDQIQKVIETTQRPFIYSVSRAGRLKAVKIP